MDSKYRIDFDIMRILLTILVVIGHASYYSHSTIWGGGNIDYFYLADITQDTKIHIIATIITSYIYSFHMPLFFFLSGEVYSYTNKNITFSDLIQKKSKRLLIPALIVFLFYYLPIMFFTGYYNSFDLTVMWQIIFPGGNYLWFLESLYICYIFIWILNRWKTNTEAIKYVLVVFVWIIGIFFWKKAVEFVPFGNPFRYFLWFYLGIKAEEIRHTIKLTYRVLFLLFVIQANIWGAQQAFGHGEILIGSISGFLIIPFWVICTESLASRISEKHSYFVKRVASYTFGIYLYSDPLNYLILYLFHRQFGNAGFCCNFTAGILYFSRIFITTFLAVLISKLIKKMGFQYLC